VALDTSSPTDTGVADRLTAAREAAELGVEHEAVAGPLAPHVVFRGEGEP